LRRLLISLFSVNDEEIIDIGSLLIEFSLTLVNDLVSRDPAAMSSHQNPSFSSFQENVIIYLSLALGGVAVIACLTAIIELILHGKVGSLMNQSSMPLFLMICDLGIAIGTMSASQQHNQCDNHQLCRFASAITQFASLGSFLWTASISNITMQQVTQLFSIESQFRNQRVSSRSGSFIKVRRSQQSAQQSMLYYHCCCWGFPLLTVIILLATSSAGFYSHDCWLIVMPSQSSHMPLAVAVLLYLFPLIGLVLYNIRVFRFLAKTISQIPFSQSLLRRFTRYLSIVIAVKAVFVVSRALLLFSGESINFAALLFVVLSGPLQGIGDFFVLIQGKGNDHSNPLIADESEAHRKRGSADLHGSHHSVRSVDALMDGGGDRDVDEDDIELEVPNPLGLSDDRENGGIGEYDVVDKDEVVEIRLSVIP
jgi:phosphate/sulfate permease